MKWDYVYAGLQVQVRFVANSKSPFGNLTDSEVQTLEQLIYMALHEFQYVRAVHAKDIAGLQKVIESMKKHTDILKDGG